MMMMILLSDQTFASISLLNLYKLTLHRKEKNKQTLEQVNLITILIYDLKEN